MDTIWLEIILIFVAVLANGYFAGSEIAVVSSRVGRLTALREAGWPGAESALRLKDASDAFLATIQIAITSVGTLASVVGGAAAVEALTPALAALPVPGASRWAGPASLALVILVITYVSLVLGELVPKALALRNPERVACFVARPVERVSRLSGSLVCLLTVSTNLVVRIVGQGSADAQGSPVSEEDVKYLLKEGAALGVFEQEEAALVHSVFEFTDTRVREIMIPRPSILGLDVTTPPASVLGHVAEIGKSRFPVYRDSIEHVIGVVTLKDLVTGVASGEPLDLARLARPPLFVPETVLISHLLRQFRQTQQEFAMVVDEYGSVAGLVTLEDVVAEIVGPLPGEADLTSEVGVSRLPDGSLLLDGMLPVDRARERLGLPVPASPEYQTVAGFILYRLAALPAPGTSVELSGWTLTVVEMDGPRIAKVKAQKGST
jgi:putative hemolysin